MDVRQLRYFVTIVNEKNNISKAAKKLHMTQPPLSQQLRSLEKSLGVQLFQREGKRLSLTSAGKSLYQRSITLLNYYDDTVLEIKEIENGIRGQLSIGVSAFHSYLLPKKINYFNRLYPEVKFKIFTGDPTRLSNLLERGDIDLAIVNLPVEAIVSSVSVGRLDSFGFSLFIPRAWGWSETKTNVTFEELEGLPLILSKREEGKMGTYYEIIDEFNRYNMKPNVVCECNDIQTVFMLVDAGLGSTIMPDYILDNLNINSIIPLKILDSTLTNESAVLWRKDRYLSKIAQFFIDSLGIVEVE
ncbi:LysR family transcriptional regulator [Aquibacillus koreensis]|uniref:LysR family transcriptional regulator n=1 Tax=Aquibacillus koreensis TaxID=279446 RepID=A0A9X3WMA1_9BACI|nr:LysR family transcriptional regulator [Aquibacillus koreensis]MCT2537148.1 LysR family transcriptional regulator [Aquibacillus koreensis]MDC3419869.1 LysR family transcriptional regulator [Aquibacillus koreensis]